MGGVGQIASTAAQTAAPAVASATILSRTSSSESVAQPEAQTRPLHAMQPRARCAP